MTFLALGVNHHTASVELREQIAFNPERLNTVFSETRQHPELADMVVVSTCNRTEIYALTKNTDDVLHWMAQCNGIDVNTLLRHVYHYENVDAMTHLMRVASGLDSLMLGEPQILGQIKNALILAKDAEVVSPHLNRLFEYAFYAAKKVRSETAVGAHAISMGYAVAQLSTQVFSHVSQMTVLIVAAGEMNTLVAKHLAEMGVAKMIICNRTRSKAEHLAQELATRVEVEVIDFDQLENNLYRADVVSSCTGSLHQVISYSAVKRAVKQRKYQPMLMVDLAVPRDIDAKVDDLDSVYLYGVDDLQAVIDDNLSQRRQAALDAEILVSQLASQFVINEKVQRAGHDIQQYRDFAEHQRQKELQLALQQLQQGVDPAELLERLSQRLTNKMLHIPSKLFREAARAEQPEHAQWLNETIQDIHDNMRKTKAR
ncbi:glutamyl-tRNA reductase [Acinetobacter qingfengensis]|uniref:Glutamyl-tRNA reductase n=1 Tax=Acinetobacter qingfengensis TaxID=1262585 RepID=A0A1E7RFY9_9GAMM|nr:glutamyl-tRNA reductase [Acinetobacter qingfengensis]KAA8732814.1 glutamyl-tRNA reductase [Acinetobacter qingfengensis]OEY98075.1 glutamyl-tRNA reductase [Acinetobacter qingfengensis]